MVMVVLLKGIFMALSIELTADHTVVLCQEPVFFRVRMTNTGPEDVEAPLLSSIEVVFTKNVASGEEIQHRRPRERHEVIGLNETLAPGKTAESIFGLFDVVDDLAPGTYDLSAAWGIGEEPEGTRSSAVRLTIRPTTPTAVSPPVDVMGGSANNREFVWVNAAAEPHTLVLSSCSFNWGVNVTARPLDIAVDPRSRPVISSPPCDEVMLAPWVAWIEGTELSFASIPRGRQSPRVMKLRLDSPGAVLVSPLHVDPEPEDVGGDDDERRDLPNGGAPIMCPGTNEFSLQSVELTPRGAKPGKSVTIDGTAPVWMHSHARSAKARRVVFAQQDGDGIALQSASWPGYGGLLSRTRSLGHWPGRLVCAGARMDLDGGLMGAFLLEGAGGDKRGPTLVSWALSAKDALEVKADRSIGWDPAKPPGTCSMEIDDKGVPTVLIRGEGAAQHIYTLYEELTPLPEGFIEGGRPYPRHAVAENK